MKWLIYLNSKKYTKLLFNSNKNSNRYFQTKKIYKPFNMKQKEYKFYFHMFLFYLC